MKSEKSGLRISDDQCLTDSEGLVLSSYILYIESQNQSRHHNYTLQSLNSVNAVRRVFVIIF